MSENEYQSKLDELNSKTRRLEDELFDLKYLANLARVVALYEDENMRLYRRCVRAERKVEDTDAITVEIIERYEARIAAFEASKVEAQNTLRD